MDSASRTSEACSSHCALWGTLVNMQTVGPGGPLRRKVVITSSDFKKPELEDCDRQSRGYRMISSSATERGTHGVQLWVRKRITKEMKHVNLASPRLLSTVLGINGHDDIAVVAPVPSKDAAPFWTSLEKGNKRLRHIFSGAHCVLVIDANAHESSHVHARRWHGTNGRK